VKTKHIIMIVLVILMLIIIIQNTEIVTFSFLIWSWSISTILLLPLTMLIGFVVGLLAYPLLVKNFNKRKGDLPESKNQE